MKLIKILIPIVCAICFSTSCKTGAVAGEGGKGDVAYISLMSSGTYADKEATVEIDNSTTFVAKVKKEKNQTVSAKNDLHSINPGKRFVKITIDGKVVYSQYVFLSAQKTKNIIL